MALADDELSYTRRQYGENNFQCVGVWEWKDKQQVAESRDGHWLVFIHGGAWRDPNINHQSFLAAINSLLSSPDVPRAWIRGFASIDYRLSPHPNHPQDPASTPVEELRDAKHPDHILDVWAALKLLDDEYKLSDGYILLGHSAGATLSYQLLMGEHVLGDGAPAPSAPLPSAIVGIAGIYDLVAIDHRHQGQYAGFITSAFGEDRDGWRRFSPSSYSGSFGKGTTTLAVSVLAWSQDDSLVDEPEVDAMTEKLVRDGAKSSTVKTLTGEHDVVWKEGTQIPPLVAKAMASLKASA